MNGKAAPSVDNCLTLIASACADNTISDDTNVGLCYGTTDDIKEPDVANNKIARCLSLTCQDLFGQQRKLAVQVVGFQNGDLQLNPPT